jgi:hypothetical protein
LTTSKVDDAIREARRIGELQPHQVRSEYAEATNALCAVCELDDVDEVRPIRAALASCVGKVLFEMKSDSTDEFVKSLSMESSEGTLFEISNVTKGADHAVKVDLNTNLFPVEGFPITIRRIDSLSTIEEKVKKAH